MNDEKTLNNSNAKGKEFMRIFELMPRTFWVEDVDSLVCHLLAEQVENGTTSGT